MHIGKELLSQNTQLEKRIIELESELRGANESIAQLSHELVQKTELINILTENEETLSENGKNFEPFYPLIMSPKQFLLIKISYHLF